jgi:hypothetical protein
MLPGAPVTRDQVELMQIDTMAAPGLLILRILPFRRVRWKMCFTAC